MPRTSKNSKNRWVHPWYKYAYCFPRETAKGETYVYTCVDSQRKATGIIWKPSNKNLAMDALERHRQAVQNPRPADTGEYKTINDAFKIFAQDYLAGLKDSTIRQYKVMWRKYLKMNYRLDQYDEIKQMVLSVKAESTNTDNSEWKRVQRVRKFFQYCIDEGWMDRNPVTKSMIPKYTDPKVDIFTDTEINAILERFRELNNFEMILLIEFALATAMRIQELINMRWEDITDREIFIKGKGDRERIIPLRVKLFDRVNLLLAELSRMNKEKVFSWKYQQTPTKSFRNAIRHINEDSGNINIDERKTFHYLRKTAINRWKTLGLDIEIRSAFAGNNIAVQVKNYLANPDAEFFEEKLKN